MLTDRFFTALSARSNAERRRAPRIPVAVDVDVATQDHFFAGQSADVSESGVFVSTHRVLPLGTRVSIEISLPTGQVLARGVVRWMRRAEDGVVPGLGIDFEDLPEVDRCTVEKFCRGRPRFITYEEVRAAAL